MIKLAAVASSVGIVLAFLVVFSAAGMAGTRGGRHTTEDATNTWAVGISGGKEEADRLAHKYEFKNLGKVSPGVECHRLHACRATRPGDHQAKVVPKGCYNWPQVVPQGSSCAIAIEVIIVWVLICSDWQ